MNDRSVDKQLCLQFLEDILAFKTSVTFSNESLSPLFYSLLRLVGMQRLS